MRSSTIPTGLQWDWEAFFLQQASESKKISPNAM